MWSGSYHVTEETSRFIISSAPEMPSPRTWRQARPLPDGRALRPTDRWPARRVRHSTPPHSHRPLIEPCQCRALRAHASWRRRPAERENAFVRAHGQKHVRGQKVPMNDRSLYTARTRARKCRLSGETAPNGITPKAGKEGVEHNQEHLRRIDLRWHDLRHEGACRLLAGGVDIRIIQLMLGHASVQQTQRYLNLTDEELRKGLEVSWINQGRPLRLASQG